MKDCLLAQGPFAEYNLEKGNLADFCNFPKFEEAEIDV